MGDCCTGFSALQRAENSSIYTPFKPSFSSRKFQCSSASRKFLNHDNFSSSRLESRKFQCSSASRKFLNPILRCGWMRPVSVSVLFSEPKIPQSRRRPPNSSSLRVSVLFSEPKIPQCGCRFSMTELMSPFQCSSASRKFLNRRSRNQTHIR